MVVPRKGMESNDDKLQPSCYMIYMVFSAWRAFQDPERPRRFADPAPSAWLTLCPADAVFGECRPFDDAVADLPRATDVQPPVVHRVK